MPRPLQRSNRRAVCFFLTATLGVAASIWAQEQTESQPQPQGNDIPSITVEPGPDRRLPERTPGFASIQGRVVDQSGAPVPGVTVLAISRSITLAPVTTTVEGIFRFRDLPAGRYELRIECAGYSAVSLPVFDLNAGDLRLLSVQITSLNPMQQDRKGASGIPGPLRLPEQPIIAYAAYPGMRDARPETDAGSGPPEVVPAYDANFLAQPDRWAIAMPEWRRYPTQPDVPYVKGHWYDPYNRNRLKGDYPVFYGTSRDKGSLQRWFFSFTGQSVTGVDVRRLPLPSGVSAENPHDRNFFGNGEQAAIGQNFRLSFDLFRGDTSFRPIDFRIHFTPEFNLNFLQTRERGLVNVDVRKGINRFDTRSASLQEAFVEAKLHDLSPNYDFVSVRAGIQQFNSDFRGFLFSDEQPGLRMFGNLRSNRINYNLAGFYLLEKDSNSGLNTLEKRGQQVYVANVYLQDFGAKGFTQQFSFHFNRDDADIHFDKNGFLVRPQPVGLVVNCGSPPTNPNCIKAHGIRAYYLGWTSSGHVGPINVSHAFYQVLGHDTFNPIAGRPVDIDGRLGALELSVDKNWMRFRSSFFYASGDGDRRFGPSRRDSTAHGFDTIVDDSHFAGGDFSFWSHEGIRLTGTGVGLVGPSSLLPSLRTNKEEGQANFVNPGLWLGNLGADFEVTPKLRAFVNVNYLRFDTTAPLELLLFQRPIRHSIGTDAGVGFEYRPPLSENIVIRGGAAALQPGRGLRDLYNGRTLVNGFVAVKFQF
jgi:hypothetical protein